MMATMYKWLSLLVLVCLAAGTMGGESQEGKAGNPWEDDFRLPSTVTPEHYDLFTYPDLTTKTFSGQVSIQVMSSEQRDHFLVHTQWLNITSTTVTRLNGTEEQPVTITSTFEYEPNQFWVIQTEVVEAGSFRITLDFSGSLTKAILGFYYSEYKDENGQSRGLATTKFEPTYARRAFPCFDEPSFKSTYSISIVRPSQDYIALSNMPVMSEVPDSPSAGLTQVTFEKSVPMVTYLVCYIVCDFTYKETILPSTMPFRVYAPAGNIDNTDYALDIGARILQMYEVMFDLPFPLPKSDMAAIPDYSSGATEHWGIITFRETAIYYNQNTSSEGNKQRVASVVAHELAHQWFGNLVTLEWWNDLWLNEGFASYIEYKGVDYVEPTWDMKSQFVVYNLQPVMVTDAQVSSHPIVQPVETPDEINAIFDSISYDKGSSVLRMLEDFMGEAAFQTGINSFLKKFAYENAVTEDLWTELTAAWAPTAPQDGKTNISDIMGTWTKQMGYPVVNVVRSSPDSITLTQQRFLKDPTAVYNSSESEYGYMWDIPVTYITSQDSTVQRVWFYRENDTITVPIDPAVNWVKINLEERGFFRVKYEAAVWNQLEDLCTNKLLGTADRANLYNDVFALGDAALLDYTVALNFSRSLVTETDYVPWVSVYTPLLVNERLLNATPAFTPFMEYVSDLVTPMYTSLGWADGGDHLQSMVQRGIVSLACESGNTACLEAAAVEFDQWILDPAYPLPLGTRRQMYRWGIFLGDTQYKWSVMWSRSLTETDATAKSNLYYGMGNCQDVATLENYIELSRDTQYVRTQDFLNILGYISDNPLGTDLVWDWVRANWEWLVDRYTLNDRYLGQLIPDITKYFSTQEKLTEMEEFFSLYPDAGAGELYRAQALETVRFNIRWVDTNADTILNWLTSQQ